jgi:hypothetical protein
VPDICRHLAMSQLSSPSHLSGETRVSMPVSVHDYPGQLVKCIRTTTLNCGLARNGRRDMAQHAGHVILCGRGFGKGRWANATSSGGRRRHLHRHLPL